MNTERKLPKQLFKEGYTPIHSNNGTRYIKERTDLGQGIYEVYKLSNNGLWFVLAGFYKCELIGELEKKVEQ